MNNTSRSIMYSFLQQISGLLLTARNCAGQSTHWPLLPLHILEQGALSGQMSNKSWPQASKWQFLLAPVGVEAPPTVINERKSTFWSSYSSEGDRQIHGPFSTFSIWLWKIRLQHTTLNVLCITAHLIKDWYYNHQFELEWRQHLCQHRVLVLFHIGHSTVSRFKQATKLTTFLIITLWWLAKFISPRNIFNSSVCLILSHFLPCMCA